MYRTVVFLLCLLSTPNSWAARFITLASTTSTENSGLYQHILPKFTALTGIQVRVVAVGTGQAINNARKGDADVLIVHHQASEEEFVASGYGVQRFNLMYNDYILVGPEHDPAQIRGMLKIGPALQTIYARKAAFTSRGDDSGTHKKEMELWQLSNLDPRSASGLWYRETGSGMGATLNTASALNAYCLTDRGTWLQFKNKGQLVLLLENDPPMFNQYGIILVNPKRHPHVKAEAGQKFIDWLLSESGQAAIAEFKINGQQAFFPNAGQQ